MAMTQKLWSINGLATELNMDRRTVAKKLAAVRPSVRAPERQPGLAPHRGPGSHPGALSTTPGGRGRMSGHLCFRAC